MGRNCCVDGCSGGWVNGVYHRFRFKLESEICAKWVAFVGKGKWVPPKETTICFEHFEDRFVVRGKRWRLNWSLSPVPTKFPPKSLKRKAADLQPNSYRVEGRKQTIFDDLDLCHVPEGFQFRRQIDHVVF